MAFSFKLLTVDNVAMSNDHFNSRFPGEPQLAGSPFAFSSSSSEAEPSGINGIGLLSPNELLQSAEENSKH